MGKVLLVPSCSHEAGVLSLGEMAGDALRAVKKEFFFASAETGQMRAVFTFGVGSPLVLHLARSWHCQDFMHHNTAHLTSRSWQSPATNRYSLMLPVELVLCRQGGLDRAKKGEGPQSCHIVTSLVIRRDVH